ncbi:hypothetical protein FSP39_022827 [Pinctada imbricata]|uniref:G-protein coupled receptors family 1 profile domain-containing protein n=1 Tax=Pinctada imbricata TaxID=66713 RepID=A0AA88XY72_PINIB|nr:hypothetical protein FSP39_022827 [Pinctada imbricata]
MFFLIFTIAAVVLNLFIIVAVRNRRKNYLEQFLNIRNILLIHLGSVGLAASILCLFFAAVVSFSGWKSSYRTVCQAQGLVQAILTQVTTWTLAAISWDKYQTIVSPFQHSNVAPIRKMLVLFCVMWITALIIGIPPLFYENGYIYQRTLGSCFMNTSTPSRHHWYGGLVLCVLFFAPLCVMLYTYAHIYRIARTHSSRIAATMIRMGCVVQVPLVINGRTVGAGPATIKWTKAMLTILQLLGTFIMTYIPFSVVIVAGLCGLDLCSFSVLVTVLSTIFQAAPVTNGATYGIQNKLLRNSFRRYVRRRI